MAGQGDSNPKAFVIAVIGGVLGSKAMVFLGGIYLFLSIRWGSRFHQTPLGWAIHKVRKAETSRWTPPRSAPKGLNKPARGNAPGTETPREIEP